MTATLGHRDAARLVLRYLLNNRRTAYTGWVELGVPGGIADVITVGYPWAHEFYAGQRDSARATYDRLKHAHDLSYAGAIERRRAGEDVEWPEAPGLTQRCDAGLPFDLKKGRKAGTPRIDIVEVKVSLADLRQDLKRSKMLGYQATATHCSVALGPEVWPGDRQRCVDELTRFGLPGEWGIDRIQRNGDLDNIRHAKAVRKAKPGELLELVLAMSRSAAYRTARRKGDPDAVQLPRE